MTNKGKVFCGCSATGSCAEHRPTLRQCFDVLRGTLVHFNERQQEFFCTVCRYRDPLGPDGNKLHDDACPLLDMTTAIEEAEREIAHLERVLALIRGETPLARGDEVGSADARSQS